MIEFLGDISPALTASLLAAAFATFGVMATALNQSWAERRSEDFAGFASGLLVSIALLHLIPESVALSVFGPWLVLVGYIVLYATNRAFGAAGAGFAAVAPVIGIGFHSFVDGLEYPVLFAKDIATGAMASLGLIIHEVAEGVIVFALLRRAQVAVTPAVVAALIVSALTTPVGAVLSGQFLASAGDDVVGPFMSLAAGALLYVGASHLPKYAIGGIDKRLGVYFFAGVALGCALAALHGLNHDHTQHVVH